MTVIHLSLKCIFVVFTPSRGLFFFFFGTSVAVPFVLYSVLFNFINVLILTPLCVQLFIAIKVTELPPLGERAANSACHLFFFFFVLFFFLFVC